MDSRHSHLPTLDSSSSSSDFPSSTPVSAVAMAASSGSASAIVPSSLYSPRPRKPPTPHHLCRALTFEDREVRVEEEKDVEEVEPVSDERDGEIVDGDADAGGLPARCLWEVMRRLPPVELLVAARVCKGWRETSRKVWKAAEELKLTVPPSSQLSLFRSVLNKCPKVVRLSLRMERLGDSVMDSNYAFDT